LRCGPDGSWIREECDPGTQVCDLTLGCVHWLESDLCGEGDGACDEQGIPWRCGDDQHYVQLESCPAGTVCVAAGVCLTCEPGRATCIEGDAWRCRGDRSAFDRLEQCDPRTTRCERGQCVSRCSLQDRETTDYGCRFWAVDLDAAREGTTEAGPGGSAGLSLLVTSVAEARPASVRVHASDGLAEVEVARASVAAGGVERIDLPARPVTAPARAFVAYRIDSDLPVVVHQLRSADARGTRASDASLLLPQASLGTDYVAVTADAATVDGAEWPAFVVVVATGEGQTEVTLDLTGDVAVPDGATASGRSVTSLLSAYQVLAVPSSMPDPTQPGAGNLSGTRVRASAPVAVFSGNVAARIPEGGDGERCCAGHLEEQLPPLHAWGRRTVGAWAPRRNPSEPEPDVWRIVAGPEPASLTWAPETPDGAPTRLEPFSSVAFEHTGHFVVDSDSPILVTHLVASSGRVGEARVHGSCDPGEAPGTGVCTLSTGFLAACAADGAERRCVPVGEPAMTVVPPVEQLRSDYVVPTPGGYALDYLVVVAPVAAGVRLDGVLLDAKELLAFDRDAVRWSRYAVAVEDGPHRVTASSGVAVVAYGYDRGASYGYAGGVDLAVRR